MTVGWVSRCGPCCRIESMRTLEESEMFWVGKEVRELGDAEEEGWGFRSC